MFINKHGSTLRFKLILSFIVPIAFIILLGVVSFMVASAGIRNNYKESATQTLSMTGKYFQFGLESIEDTSFEYSVDKTFIKYFSNLHVDDVIEKSNDMASIDNTISAKQIKDKFINDIYLISDQVRSLMTKNTPEDGLYARIKESDPGQLIASNNSKAIWIGQNDNLDNALGTKSSDYSLRLMGKIQSANAYIIIDVSNDIVKDILTDLQFSALGFVGMVTEDGKEITIENYQEKIFSDQDFYRHALESDNISGSEYVNYQNKKYLFVYSKIENSGAMLCTLIPKGIITKQADGIKMITIIISIFACIIATSIGLTISYGIDKTIKSVILKLKMAAKGDLTVEFQTKRKDEFRLLISEIQHTFGNMKQLIQKTISSSIELKDSSVNVSETSAKFLYSTREITSSIQEIEQGILQQAKDAEECLQNMDNLSKKIIVVNENTKEISQLADDTKISINQGTECTYELNNQTKSTINITTNIIGKIQKLAEKSLAINDISNVISGIAGSTNLLSLNASIEASRAGEAGRGFAVVASEIRNLAEQSKQSVDEIKEIINGIQEDITNVLVTAKASGEVLKAQEAAVKNTTDSYRSINENVENLMLRLTNIVENVDNIEEARVCTLGSIENISAVLEEIAASSNTVNQASNEQLLSVETMNLFAKTLDDNADELIEAISKFTI